MLAYPTRRQSTVEAELARRNIRKGEIARRYPCSPVWVSRIISGRVPPPARFREVVAELTGLPEHELFA
jgi:hypothetical protein